ncbi:ribbon-helix-helix protein, CopG family [Alicyclobacillus ferrooxydans]|uniref:ribbon-helix-helix protein, CopG family n=1 Tax=Alicyclobacillus ferrooxydans TaxID=471514 RepID=UPI003CCC07DD
MYFTDRQVKQLSEEAKAGGLSFSEHVRRILDHHLDLGKKESMHVESAITRGN